MRIRDDPGMGYYHSVTRFSNMYQYEIEAGTGYGYTINDISIPEYVQFDGCVV